MFHTMIVLKNTVKDTCNMNLLIEYTREKYFKITDRRTAVPLVTIVVTSVENTKITDWSGNIMYSETGFNKGLFSSFSSTTEDCWSQISKKEAEGYCK